jgi:hypothetical protein
LNQQVIARVVDSNSYDDEVTGVAETTVTENYLAYSKDTTSTVDASVVEQEADDVEEVVELNVGGQRITTFRSTLTAVPNSTLALMFTETTAKKRNLPIDKHGVIVFDYNPTQFNFLLDQLRMIGQMPPKPAYDINILVPLDRGPANFSHMIHKLGLIRE